MTDTERISHLLNSAWQFRESEHWEDMLALAAEARALSEKTGFAPGVPRSLAVQAFVHYIRADFRTALAECIDALQYAGHPDMGLGCGVLEIAEKARLVTVDGREPAEEPHA